MATVLIVALEREAAPLRRRGMEVVTAGVGRARAALAADRVIQQFSSQLTQIIVAGFAGALTDDLSVGDVVRVSEIVDEAGEVWPCVGGDGRRCVTVDRVIGEPAAKRALGERTGAAVVDMESAAVARACAAAGVPCGCVRVVSDAVNTRLSPRLIRVFESSMNYTDVLQFPLMIPELWRLARDTRMAAIRLAAALHADLSANVSSAAFKPL